MANHYTWPDIGEKIKFKGVEGTVVSRAQGRGEFTFKNESGERITVKLVDFIVDEILNQQ